MLKSSPARLPRSPSSTRSSNHIGSPSRAHDLELIERRLEAALVDLRQVRRGIIADQRDSGALGSRGLTQFVVDLLKANTQPAWTIQEMLAAAEKAGYAVPTLRTMSKRLTEWQYRKGQIKWQPELSGWTWRGEEK